MKTMVNSKDVWQWLEEVKDPEVPVLNIVDLGIIRGVEIRENEVEVAICPTYSGCPALFVIEEDIKACLNAQGLEQVKVRKVHFPPWTTENISEQGREKLRQYGIAPPLKLQAQAGATFMHDDNRAIKCPRCGGEQTTLKSFFGSTACKALYYCNQCQEPFDYFKCH